MPCNLQYFFGWLVIAGIVTAGGVKASEPHNDLQELMRLLTGDYFSAADGGARAGRPIYMRIRAIDSPITDVVALYSEMRHDGPEGELYRQLVYLFDENATAVPIVMRTLAFADQATATKLVNDSKLWVRESLETRSSLAVGCETRWTRESGGFLGAIDPATCQITGRRGDQRSIEGRTLITTESIGQLERGYDPEGRLLFGNPDGELYIWPRLTSPDREFNPESAP